jgi:hypothetical protein
MRAEFERMPPITSFEGGQVRYEIRNKYDGDFNYDKPFKPACVPVFNIGVNLCTRSFPALNQSANPNCKRSTLRGRQL